jgi:hypothetical protein
MLQDLTLDTLTLSVNTPWTSYQKGSKCGLFLMNMQLCKVWNLLRIKTWQDPCGLGIIKSWKPKYKNIDFHFGC